LSAPPFNVNVPPMLSDPGVEETPMLKTSALKEKAPPIFNEPVSLS
jgi:hypothetical protein